MWVRFEHDLHSAPFLSEDKSVSGSRVIACRTLADCHYTVQLSAADNESSVDESEILTLLVLVLIVLYTLWSIQYLP